MNQRLQSSGKLKATFSIMKGVAIISVVLGHCASYSKVEQFVNQYHLAVFFFVAGYFFKENYLNNPKAYVVKRIKSLYLPFVKYGLAFLLLHNIFAEMHVVSSHNTLSTMLGGAFSVIFLLTSTEELMGAMWFCTTLLWVSVFSLCLLMLSKKLSAYTHNMSATSFVIFSLFITIASILNYYDIKSPYCIWQNIIICGVFYMGHLFRYFEKLVRNRKYVMYLVSFLGFFFISMMVSRNYSGRLQANMINEEQTAILLLIAFIGCLMIYSISALVESSNCGIVLSKVGDSSFSIMALHFLAFKIVNILQCYCYDLSYSRIADFPTINHSWEWTILYVIVGVVLPMVLVTLIDKMKACCVKIWRKNII